MVPDFLTIAEAARLIQRKELSPLELVESRLDRIARLDGSLNSFICVMAEEARAAAAAAEAEIAAGDYRGPLHGIPIGLKDLYETAGIATTGHSKVMQGHVPRADAFSVTRLRDAARDCFGQACDPRIRTGRTIVRPALAAGPQSMGHEPRCLVAHQVGPAPRSQRDWCSAALAATLVVQSATPRPIAVSPVSSRLTVSSAGWASCHSPSHSTTPAP